MVKKIEDLVVFQLAFELSGKAWEIYEHLPVNLQFHMSGQFLDCAGSVGANVSEGFGRYHYRDGLRLKLNNFINSVQSSIW